MNKATSLKSAVVNKDENTAHVVECLRAATDAIRQEYLRRHNDPWVIAFSGGKDSTLLLQLTWEMLSALPNDKRHRKIYIVGNDTLVESPLVIHHLRATMEKIDVAITAHSLPMETLITRPNIDQTFWVNVIGRGYIPPTRNFRWCTDRMKIIPTSKLLKKLVRAHKRAVLLVGTRMSESLNRHRSMKKHSISGRAMNPHSAIAGCRMFAPLAEFEDEDVWLTLIQRKPPWGGSHRELITLYRNAAGGECPLVLNKADAPSCGTTSPRFGCWTCTVVNKDRSLQGLIDSGYGNTDSLKRLFDFREWLIELREDGANRYRVRRNGEHKTREDGTPVLGPFTLAIRKKILESLIELQNDIGERLITEAELDVIRDIWRRDQVIQSCRDALSATISSPIEKKAA